MKICSKCGVEKILSAFNWKSKAKGRKQSACRECYVKIHKEWYDDNLEKHKQRAGERRNRIRREIMAKIRGYLLQNPCDCGEFDPTVLEFDHNDPKEKKHNISSMVRLGYSWRTVEEEIKKCTVRCSNCHKRKTAVDQGWYRILSE